MFRNKQFYRDLDASVKNGAVWSVVVMRSELEAAGLTPEEVPNIRVIDGPEGE